MNLPQQLAKHIRDVHFGGNWTVSTLKEHLEDVSWQEAATKVHHLNTIAVLVFHINYYVDAVLKVLQGSPLTSKDTESFTHPPITGAADWNAMLDKMWTDAETLASLVGQLPESRLWETFASSDYGTYYRNIQGVVEHTHYHLGQIVLVKKILRQGQPD